MSEFLSSDDLRAFTGKARREGQARVLEADGVPFKWRGRELLVLWEHVRAHIEGRPIHAPRAPNMGAIQ